MAERRSNSYIARQGELLAEDFLVDLEPECIIANRSDGVPFDYVAFFSKPDRTPVIFGVDVMATQQEIRGRYPFSANMALRFLRSNIPVLVIVIDVNTKDVHFNWIKDAIPAEKQAGLIDMQTCRLHLRKSSEEEIERLKDAILADHMITAA